MFTHSINQITNKITSNNTDSKSHTNLYPVNIGHPLPLSLLSFNPAQPYFPQNNTLFPYSEDLHTIHPYAESHEPGYIDSYDP